MFTTVHGFVDGAYVRQRCQDAGRPNLNPHEMVLYVLNSQGYRHQKNSELTRVTYYDAAPENESEISTDLTKYWGKIERLPDTQLGFGTLRGGKKKKPPRQKGVDTLIATDMLVGAFTGIFRTAILVAGDADFVPVVLEIKRRGVNVIVAAAERSISEDLLLASDRFFDLGELTESRYSSL